MAVYLDHAATGFPKPAAVLRAARRLLSAPLGNPGRSGHVLSRRADGVLFSARETLARFFKTAPERIVFTSGATSALNLAIRGCVRHLVRSAPVTVATTVYEHNSVLRPLYDLEKEGGIRLFFCPAGQTDAENLIASLPPDVSLCVFTAQNNVTGLALPLRAIAKELQKKGVPLIVDASQAAGVLDVDFESIPAAFFCAPGHKGLQGLMGAGVLAVSPEAPFLPEPVFSGGSGIDPFEKEMPPLLPERLEAGTPPVYAVASMEAGVRFLLERGLEEIREKERKLKKELAEGLSFIRGVTLYGQEHPLGPLSFRQEGETPFETAERLEKNGVFTRAGIHCAPLTHLTLGTAPEGTVRLSVGALSTLRDVKTALRAMTK